MEYVSKVLHTLPENERKRFAILLHMCNVCDDIAFKVHNGESNPFIINNQNLKKIQSIKKDSLVLWTPQADSIISDPLHPLYRTYVSKLHKDLIFERKQYIWQFKKSLGIYTDWKRSKVKAGTDVILPEEDFVDRDDMLDDEAIRIIPDVETDEAIPENILKEDKACQKDKRKSTRRKIKKIIQIASPIWESTPCISVEGPKNKSDKTHLEIDLDASTTSTTMASKSIQVKSCQCNTTEKKNLISIGIQYEEPDLPPVENKSDKVQGNDSLRTATLKIMDKENYEILLNHPASFVKEFGCSLLESVPNTQDQDLALQFLENAEK